MQCLVLDAKAERRKVSLEIPSENQFMKAAKFHGVTMAVINCRIFNQGGMLMLQELHGRPSGVRETVREIRNLTDVRQVVAGGYDVRVTPVLVLMNVPSICRAARDRAIHCFECPFNSGDETLTWSFMVQRPTDLKQIVENLNRDGLAVRIKDLSPVTCKGTPTLRQKTVAMAIEKGYFDFPRKTGLTELSCFLRIRPSTLSEILRSAERRIMQNGVPSLTTSNPEGHAKVYMGGL